MPKSKENINPETGKRLKKLLKESKITQKQLSKKIKISQQRISDICTGRVNATENVLQKICNLKPFKNYDLLKKWLRGDEVFKSTNEKILNEEVAQRYKGNLLLTGLDCFLNLSGYELTTLEEQHGDKWDLVSATIRKYDQEKALAELSPEEINTLGRKLKNLFEVYIKDYFD